MRRVRSLVGVSLLLALSLPSVSGGQKDSHEDEVRALIETQVKPKGPGVAVLVSRNGMRLIMTGYGLADVSRGAPITADSLFDLASVSKQMTGTAILTLVEKGKVDLDRPVAEYLTDFQVAVKGRPVTVRDLFHHVIGVGRLHERRLGRQRCTIRLAHECIISARSQEMAWTNGRYDNGKPIHDEDGDGYGFGWVIDSKRRVVSHSGCWNGTATALLLDLEDGLTVAVLSNDEKADASDLAEEIAALFKP